jgi:DNA invertase Pin-like site-specific DNA recombinase
VWKLDRISRKMLDGLHIMRFWLGPGVGIISITQQIDMTGPIGNLIASLLFAISEFQLAPIKENQAAGIAQAKQRGVYKGRKKGSLKGSPERVVKLRTKKKLTAAQIAAIQGISERTVKSYLQQHHLTVARAKSNIHPSVN